MTNAITTIKHDRYSVDAPDAINTFAVGITYHGSLLCAHGSYTRTCVKRTAKSVWFQEEARVVEFENGRTQELPARKPVRSKIKWDERLGGEITDNDGWFFTAYNSDNASEPNSY